MPADGNNLPQTPAAFMAQFGQSPAMTAALLEASKRQPVAVRTLIDTAHAYDAHLCGYDCAAAVDGGFRVVFDGRHGIPSLIISGPGGEVSITGRAAISQLAQAAEKAEVLADRQAGVL